MNTNTKISDEEIAAIYKETFESMPGALRAAPECAPLVIAFARAILEKGDKGNLAGGSNEPPSRLTIDELRQWAKYIVYKRDPWDKDHACEQCGGQIVAEGFACAYHQAEAFLRASQGNGGRD